MNHSIKMGMIGLAVVIAVLYAGDFLLIRYKLVHHQAAVDTVQVSRYYAIAEKNNKVEFQYDQSENRECVNALFPHAGDEPCWYLRRHHEERIDE